MPLPASTTTFRRADARDVDKLLEELGVARQQVLARDGAGFAVIRGHPGRDQAA